MRSSHLDLTYFHVYLVVLLTEGCNARLQPPVAERPERVQRRVTALVRPLFVLGALSGRSGAHELGDGLAPSSTGPRLQSRGEATSIFDLALLKGVGDGEVSRDKRTGKEKAHRDERH